MLETLSHRLKQSAASQALGWICLGNLFMVGTSYWLYTTSLTWGPMKEPLVHGTSTLMVLTMSVLGVLATLFAILWLAARLLAK
jgi:hypothetical protein